MRDQLRVYQLRPGAFEDFFENWTKNIVPAREACGFEIVAAWHARESNEFIWIVRWPGEGSFEEADAAYYASPRRASLPNVGALFAESMKVRMLSELPPFLATRTVHPAQPSTAS